MKKLSLHKIDSALQSVPHWTEKGPAITRTYEFKDFVAAMRFVNAVAREAEEAWHHPDIDIRWNKVAVTLTSHDAGGLTDADFSLAARFDELVQDTRLTGNSSS